MRSRFFDDEERRYEDKLQIILQSVTKDWEEIMAKRPDLESVLRKLDKLGWTVSVQTLAAPFQMDGTLPDGAAFYFRERHDVSSLRIWLNGRIPDRIDSPQPDWQYSIVHSSKYEVDQYYFNYEVDIQELYALYLLWRKSSDDGPVYST